MLIIANKIDDQIQTTCKDTKCECEDKCPYCCPGYSIAVALVSRIKMSQG